MIHKSKILPFLMLLFVVACKKGTGDFLTVEKKQLIFSVQATSERITCSSNATIEAVSSQPAWCKCTVDGSDKTIVVYVSRNDGADSRERAATVTVTAGKAEPVSIEVKQNSLGNYFSVEGNTDLQFKWNVDQRAVRVQTNIVFTAISSNPEWCTTEIKDDVYNLNIKVDENFTGKNRTATVTVAAPGFENATIAVSQDNFSVPFDKFEIKNGVNISEWLLEGSQHNLFTRADAEYIAGLGFDHIRIPICEWQMFEQTGTTTPGAIKPATWALLKKGLEWCAEFNMRAIVDLHRLQVYPTDAVTRERFYNVWREISAELKKYPVGLVAYEILNEPGFLSNANNYKEWNDLSTACFNVIRGLEPNRMIMLGSAGANGVWESQYLSVPNDPNVMITVHFYRPFLFTHYNASWITKGANWTFPVHYPGETIASGDQAKAKTETGRNDDVITEYYTKLDDSNVINQLFHPDLERAKFGEIKSKSSSTGKKVWIGEYGCISNAPHADKVQWYKDLYKIFERNNMARCHWEYRHHSRNDGFGLRDRNGTPDMEVINAILGKN